MKNLLNTLCVIAILLLTSCNGHKSIIFSNESWSYSAVSGEIANSDSTLRFFLGDNSLDPEKLIRHFNFYNYRKNCYLCK